MEKIDLKHELNPLYKPSARDVVMVDVPAMNFLMIDGAGDPNSNLAFSEAVEALFSVSYHLKFEAKKGSLAIDYGVMPLEGLWWAEDMSLFRVDDKSNWQWTLMIMQPQFISQEMVYKAIAGVKAKKNPPAIDRLRFNSFEEGRAAQILHVGPFTEEGPSVDKVHRFIEKQGGQRSGQHHEIYLSDIRLADPSKWKTIIRQPFV